MGLLTFNKISVAGALILSLVPTPVYSQQLPQNLVPTPVYSQQLPQNLVPENGKEKYCENVVTGLDGKELSAIIHVYRDTSIPSLIMIEFGEPSYRFPDNPEKSWPYTALDRIRFVVNGNTFGDDMLDYVYFSKDGKVIGWNAEGKKSSIGKKETTSFNSVVNALQTCK